MNINNGLTKQVVDVVIANLEKAQLHFQDIITGKNELSELKDIEKQLHIMTNNMKLIGLEGEYVFLSKLQRVIDYIYQYSQETDLKTVRDDLVKVNFVFDELIKYLRAKVEILNTKGDRDFFIIELWNEWNEINGIIGEKVKVLDLFFPAVNEKRMPIDFYYIDYADFRQKTHEAYQDYVDIAQQVLSINLDKELAEKAKESTVPEVESVRAHLKQLHYIVSLFAQIKAKEKEDYYGYFLALRQRLALAIEKPDCELGSRQSLYNAIINSLKIIESFRLDTGVFDHTVLKQLLYQFVLKSNFELLNATEQGAEVLKLYSLDKFFARTLKSIDAEEQERRLNFSANYTSLQKLIGSFSGIINRIKNYGRSDEFALPDSFSSFKVIVSDLLKFEPLFSENVREAVFAPLKELNTDNIVLNESIIKSLIGYAFLLSEYVELKEYVDAGFVQELSLQSNKLLRDLHREGGDDYTINFANILQNKRKLTYLSIYNVLRQELIGVKDTYAQYLKTQNVELKPSLFKLSELSAVFSIMERYQATRLLNYVSEITLKFISDGYSRVSDFEKDNWMQSLQSIEVYLEQLSQGDENPEAVLTRCIKQVFQEEETKVLVQVEFNYVKDADYHNGKLGDAIIVGETEEVVVKEEKPREISAELNAYLSSASTSASSQNIANTSFFDTLGDGVQTVSLDNIYEDFELIFDEAEEMSQLRYSAIESLKQDPNNFTFKQDLKRSSHSLKGGFNQMGLSQIGASFAITEKTIKDIYEKDIPISAHFLDVYNQMFDLCMGYVDQLKNLYDRGINSGVTELQIDSEKLAKLYQEITEEDAIDNSYAHSVDNNSEQFNHQDDEVSNENEIEENARQEDLDDTPASSGYTTDEQDENAEVIDEQNNKTDFAPIYDDNDTESNGERGNDETYDTESEPTYAKIDVDEISNVPAEGAYYEINENSADETGSEDIHYNNSSLDGVDLSITSETKEEMIKRLDSMQQHFLGLAKDIEALRSLLTEK